jgi:hypothetical protein
MYDTAQTTVVVYKDEQGRSSALAVENQRKRLGSQNSDLIQ